MKTIRCSCYGIVVRCNRTSGTIRSNLHHPTDSATTTAALDALESLVLAHAIAGVDIRTPAYGEGVKTAVDAIINNL